MSEVQGKESGGSEDIKRDMVRNVEEESQNIFPKQRKTNNDRRADIFDVFWMKSRNGRIDA